MARKIIKGHLNELKNKMQSDEKLMKITSDRLKVCESCPLYKKTMMGYICNPAMTVNTVHDDKIVMGCGCRLKAKAAVVNESCPANKWRDVDLTNLVVPNASDLELYAKLGPVLYARRKNLSVNAQ